MKNEQLAYLSTVKALLAELDDQQEPMLWDQKSQPPGETTRLGELILSTEPVEPGDVFFVVSNSGRNPVPVEVAEAALRRGAKVVALTSRQHSAAVAARGGGSTKLSDVADLVIDTHAPLGDAAIPIGDDLRVGGVSSVMTLVIIQTIVAATVTILIERGIQPPVFKSGSVDGSDEWNAEQIRRLGRRVPTLLRSSVS